MRVQHRKYDQAFRQQAVDLVERTDRPLAHVAQSLGVPSATLHYWYVQLMAKRRGKPRVAPASGAPIVAAETTQQKLARLERENVALRKELEDLKLDKEILKKAAAFFAKESK